MSRPHSFVWICLRGTGLLSVFALFLLLGAALPLPLLHVALRVLILSWSWKSSQHVSHANNQNCGCDGDVLSWNMDESYGTYLGHCCFLSLCPWWLVVGTIQVCCLRISYRHIVFDWHLHRGPSAWSKAMNGHHGKCHLVETKHIFGLRRVLRWWALDSCFTILLWHLQRRIDDNENGVVAIIFLCLASVACWDWLYYCL